MQEFTTEVRQALGKGLRPSVHTPRNSTFLALALGAFPEDGVMQALPQLDAPLLPVVCEFPFPQIFRLRRMVIVGTKDALYQYESNGDFTLLYQGTKGGWTWTVADFGEYIVMTNGAVLITRDPLTGVFDQYADCVIPPCLCVCNLNGQLILGGPGAAVPDGFTGE